MAPHEFLDPVTTYRSRPETNKTYEVIGKFLVYYSNVEYHMLRVVAAIINPGDYASLELSLSRLDGKQLLNCFRKLTQCTKNSPLGARLHEFESKIIKIRNRVAHTWIYFDGPEDNIFYFGTLTQNHITGIQAPKFDREELLEKTVWMMEFARDLSYLKETVETESKGAGQKVRYTMHHWRSSDKVSAMLQQIADEKNIKRQQLIKTLLCKT